MAYNAGPKLVNKLPQKITDCIIYDVQTASAFPDLSALAHHNPNRAVEYAEWLKLCQNRRLDKDPRFFHANGDPKSYEDAYIDNAKDYPTFGKVISIGIARFRVEKAYKLRLESTTHVVSNEFILFRAINCLAHTIDTH